MSYKSVAKTTLIMIVIFLITLKVLDFFLGTSTFAALRVKNEIRSSRVVNLREFAPNLNTWVSIADYEKPFVEFSINRNYLFRTNKDGFIIGPRDFALNTDSSDIDIIFLGGSTTECRYVDEDKRFPYLVGDLLRKPDGTSIKTLNGGVSGSNSMHSLVMELGKVLPLRPRYVVFMDAINDLGQISKAGSYWAGPLDRALISDPTHNVHNNNFYRVGKLIKNILIPNSWELLKSVFQAHRAITVDEWALYRKKNINIVGVRDRMLQDFSASLKSLIAVSRSWGIEPILMTQFNRVNEADDFSRFVYESMPQTLSWLDFVQLYKEANGIIRDVAHREKVLLIDLDKHIPANKDYMYDPVHLTQKGSEMVASHVANSLVINRSSDFVMNKIRPE